MKMKFDEKMMKVKEMMNEMKVEGRVEEFRDCRYRVVRGVMSVWVNEEKDKKKVEEEVKKWEWLGKSEVLVGVWRM